MFLLKPIGLLAKLRFLRVAEFQQNLGLPPLDSQVWQQKLARMSGLSVCTVKRIQWFAVSFARGVLKRIVTAEVITKKLRHYWRDLLQPYPFLIDGIPGVTPYPHVVRASANTERTIRIHSTRKVRQQEFIHLVTSLSGMRDYIMLNLNSQGGGFRCSRTTDQIR
jgi:hypothetical protein